MIHFLPWKNLNVETREKECGRLCDDGLGWPAGSAALGSVWAALPLTLVPSCKMEITALASQGHRDYSRNPVIGWAGDDIIEKGLNGVHRFTH